MDLRAAGEGRADHLRRVRVSTTAANTEVAAYHSKAMPVILTQPAEWEATSVILPEGSTDGSYRVEFNKKIDKCVFTGTLGTTGSSGVVSPGYLTVAGDALSVKGVFVQTFNSSGALTPSSFHLLVSC